MEKTLNARREELRSTIIKKIMDIVNAHGDDNGLWISDKGLEACYSSCDGGFMADVASFIFKDERVFLSEEGTVVPEDYDFEEDEDDMCVAHEYELSDLTTYSLAKIHDALVKLHEKHPVLMSKKSEYLEKEADVIIGDTDEPVNIKCDVSLDLDCHWTYVNVVQASRDEFVDEHGNHYKYDDIDNVGTVIDEESKITIADAIVAQRTCKS